MIFTAINCLSKAIVDKDILVLGLKKKITFRKEFVKVGTSNPMKSALVFHYLDQTGTLVANIREEG